MSIASPGLIAVEHGIDLAGILLVHRNADAQVGPGAAERAHDLEAAEMRSEEEAALAARRKREDDLFAMDADVENIAPVT